MSVIDPLYFVFLTVVLAFYYLLPAGQIRLGFLTIAGYGLYGLIAPHFFLILVVVTLLAYGAGLLLSMREDHFETRTILIISIALLLLPLLYYKYTAFILLQLRGLGVSPRWADDWIATHMLLPIGISFYVFQAIAYVADVYLGVAAAEKRLLRFALFMSFFPILTAGPIERFSRLSSQFDLPLSFDAERILSGLRLVLFGITLKFAVADPLGVPVDKVFAGLDKVRPAFQTLAAIFFSFQIYADVFAYSLIAVGTGRLFGIELTMNFRQPFLSDNIQEFWRRWHISLSTWLRDYLFFPMRAHWRKLPSTGPVMAVVVTFIIAGIWHGAGWNYVVYGLSQGLFLAGSILTLKRRDKFWKKWGVPLIVLRPLRILFTFLMVTISLVFVRSANLHDAWHVVGRFFSFSSLAGFAQAKSEMLNPEYLFCIGIVILSDVLVRMGWRIETSPRILQAAVYGFCGAVMLYGWVVDNVPTPFIYYKY